MDRLETYKGGVLPSSVSYEMMQAVTEKLFREKIVRRRVWLRVRQVAAAAAIIILIGASAVLYILNKDKQNVAVKTVAAVEQPVLKIDTLWVKKENRTKKTLAILLPDGSTVRLKKKCRAAIPVGVWGNEAGCMAGRTGLF